MSSLSNRQDTSLTTQHAQTPCKLFTRRSSPPSQFNPTSKGLPRAFGACYPPFLQEEHPQLQPVSQDTLHPHDVLPPSTPLPATCSANSGCCTVPHICYVAPRNTWDS